MTSNGLPKPVSKMSQMLFREISARHQKENAEMFAMMAEQDGVPLDGTISLNTETWQWSTAPKNPPAELTLHRHDGAPQDG